MTDPQVIPEQLPVVVAGTAIPKVIHQVYFSKNLPPIVQANVDKIRALNPGWEYRFYDDDQMAQYVRDHYGAEVFLQYDSINRKYGASRADFFRYLLIYNEGGVYLDIKSSLERPLDEVLLPDDVYLLSRWRNSLGELYEGWGMHNQLKQFGGHEFQQWHVIAAPGHPFLRAVIEKVRDNIEKYNPLLHDTGKGGVLRVTGPIAYTQSIAPLLQRYKHRIVDSQGDLGLVYSIFGATGNLAHKSIFRFHYTELQEPVTALGGFKKLLWLTFGPVQNYLVRPLRNIAFSVSKRIASGPVRRG
jgi:hypothetical protein